MAAGIDLLAGVLEGLGENVRELLAQQNFLVILPDAVSDSAPRVKQSAYALIGTCATVCIEALMPILPQLLPLCCAGLGPGMNPTVSNNASWAIGEICIKVPDFMGPHLDQM